MHCKVPSAHVSTITMKHVNQPYLVISLDILQNYVPLVLAMAFSKALPGLYAL